MRTIDGSWIEYDFSQLRRSDSRVSGEAYWGHRMDELLGRYLTPLVVLTDSPQATERVSAELKASAASGVLKDYVSEVQDAHDVIPAQQPEKIAEVAEIREILTPRIRAELSPEQRSAIEPYLPPDSLHVLRRRRAAAHADRRPARTQWAARPRGAGLSEAERRDLAR